MRKVAGGLLLMSMSAASLAGGPRQDLAIIERGDERCVWPVRMSGPDLGIDQEGGLGSVTVAAEGDPVCTPIDRVVVDGFEGSGAGVLWGVTVHSANVAAPPALATGCTMAAHSLFGRQRWFVELRCP